MLKLKQLGKKAFTIVELLIVIVVIGLLALLVLNNVGGATADARDAQRKTDINAIHSQLEIFYARNGNYPGTLAVASFPGLDADALTDPDGVAVNGTGGDYTYTPAPAGCTDNCTSYALSTTLEAGGTHDKNSLVN